MFTSLYRTAATLLLALLGGSMLAQHHLYTLRDNGRFDRTRHAYEFNEGDSLVFEKTRWILHHADSTYDRGTYPRIDAFYLSDPGPGLYCPSYLKSNDFESESSQFCFQRSKESAHFILFWEAGFGNDPTKSDKAFNPDSMLTWAEEIFAVNTGKLGFSQPGSSTTLDNYKIMMFAHYTDTWMAYGSGQDNKVGSLDVNHDAANDKFTVAHEIGHTFQYIVGCDYGTSHGWRYGFGDNASGGCAWWESCAQWQAAKVYPESQFNGGWSSGIYSYSHMNLLNETWRYSNFFVQDYWCQLHGQDFIGRLWKESVLPEDPVEAYLRLTGESQEDFNKDVYDYACRAITWDIDGLRELGAAYQDNFSPRLNDAGEGWWQVDSTYCIENYGFNITRLNVPAGGTEVCAQFQGMAGADGYRAVNTDKAGWRYGFVAQTADGNCVYGSMNSAADGTASLSVPDGTQKLWFVTTGAPTEHWRHPWNDDTSDDEQWPYRVKFSNTNVKGYYYFPADYQRHDTTAVVDLALSANSTSTTGSLDVGILCEAFGLQADAFKRLTPSKQTDSLYVRVLDENGQESDQLGSPYAFMYLFRADGSLCENSQDSSMAYYLMWSGYYSKLYVGGQADQLVAGTTYSPTLVFHYKASDGKDYTATIRVNIRYE